MMANIILLISGILSGLIAGLFYGFSVSVIPGLRLMPPKQHILAMQAINVKIKNLIFLLSFMGPTLLFPLAAFLQRGTEQFPFLVGASILHIIGVNGITIAGNVPLNDALDRVDVNTISDSEAEQIRTNYNGVGSRWMQLHHVRTVASILATALVIVAALSESS